jgi:uncharacterized protein (DUF433 family)
MKKRASHSLDRFTTPKEIAMSITSNSNDQSPSHEASARQYKYLKPKRKSAYRQLFVMGRIFPWTIYGDYVHEEEPMTVEEIAADWEIPVEAVQEAIEYYESRPPEMLEDFRREARYMEAVGINDPSYKRHPTPRDLNPQEINEIMRG